MEMKILSCAFDVVVFASIYKTIFLLVLTMINLIHEYNTVPIMNFKNKCE